MDVLTRDDVVDRLERAGATLLALNVGPTGPAGYRSNMPDIVRAAEEAYGYTEARQRVVPPDARAIAEMDQALAWISLIPAEKFVVRRIVNARALTNPLTGRHLFSWAQLGRQLRTHHEAVRRWHDEGIGIIVRALARPGLCAASGGRVGPGSRSVAGTLQRIARKAGSIRAVEFV